MRMHECRVIFYLSFAHAHSSKAEAGGWRTLCSGKLRRMAGRLRMSALLTRRLKRLHGSTLRVAEQGF
jgi:hypothetical protein